MVKIRRALISVFSKEGIVDLARELQKLKIEIVSTGGTATLLKNEGIKVKEVSELTGHPEILSGRVKTLHPKIHAGILALRDDKGHLKQLEEYDIDKIDMVVVNLYPFQDAISKKDVDFKEAIEMIDIGGPAMIRSAAKNFSHVAVLTSPSQYSPIMEQLKKNKGELAKETLTQLALKAFKYTARYDAIISDFLRNRFDPALFPNILNLTFEKIQDLRYGENPHQKAAFYKDPFVMETCIANAKQLQGKELSYNNILDVNDAFELVKEFKEPTATIIKHTNPCGVATREKIHEAFKDAYACDPKSAFGCIVALNMPCNRETAELMKPYFIEAVIAPVFDKEALNILKEKKNLRLLESGKITKSDKGFDIRKVTGGLLAQTRAYPELKEKDLMVMTKKKPSKDEIKDMMFAFKVCKHVKSNCVVLAKDETAIGIGPGQTSRVDSAMIAVRKAGDKSKGSVMASDAFFPFRDSVDEAAKAGITAIIQPGGSIRDKEVIQAANDHGIAMVFTGIRLFRH